MKPPRWTRLESRPAVQYRYAHDSVPPADDFSGKTCPRCVIASTSSSLAPADSIAKAKRSPQALRPPTGEEHVDGEAGPTPAFVLARVFAADGAGVAA